MLIVCPCTSYQLSVFPLGWQYGTATARGPETFNICKKKPYQKDDLAWISKEKEEGFRGRAFLDNYSECIHACGRN